MLWVAGGLAILAGMPQLGLAIFVVIVLNGLFAFFQEYRAEKASERLRDLLPRRVTVIRDRRRQSIDTTEVVPGDVVVLTAGDRISADVRLANVHGLSVDTSTLSGESVPTTPQAGETIFAGTFAVEGEAIGIVTAIGKSTRLAQIAQMTAAGRRPPSPLALELNRVVQVIALVSVAVGSVFLVIASLAGIRLTDAFLFALGVTVALVPEGLLPTVTLSLAMGAQRMAARGALVRRLESVETLGSTTFICTDKTGTLTQNQMSVVEAWVPGGRASVEGSGYNPAGTVQIGPKLLPSFRELASAAALYSNGRAVLREGRWIAQGNPLEVALDVFARRLNVDIEGEEANSPAVRRFPFDPRRRRMSMIVGNRVIVRGAPEAVLERCVEIGDAEQVVSHMAERGLRVIAIAGRALDGIEIAETPHTLEVGLTLLGLVGIEDPPRLSVADSIAACRRAGIRIAMVTGDHPATAGAIAREVGLWTSDKLVIEGKDLPQDEEILGALMDRDGIIVSRVSPEEKLRIARALRERGHVVAMTGDGVNDAPALHEADIGVAMGLSGTDVAREAADLVLLDDNFATIVAAIEQGHTTFANTRRFLTYHLSANIAELTPFVVWALSGGRIPLALGVLQILTFDVGSDVMPALALGSEAPSTGVLQTRMAGRHLLDRPVLVRAFGLLGCIESIMVMAAFLGTYVGAGWRPGHPLPIGSILPFASGAAFLALGIGQTANAFACRSTTRWPGALGWASNHLLLHAIVVQLSLLAAFLLVRPLALLLGHSAPHGWGFVIALLAFPAVLIADMVQKRWKKPRWTGRLVE
jgi:magnesium-transporting ATPase (P-type)